MLPHVEASLLLIYAVCENFKIQNHSRIMYCIKGMWSQVLINTLQGQYPWSMLNQHSSNTSVDTQDQHSIDILVDSQLSFDRCIWASRHSADYWLTACWSSADWVLTEYQSGFRMRCWWGWGCWPSINQDVEWDVDGGGGGGVLIKIIDWHPLWTPLVDMIQIVL